MPQANERIKLDKTKQKPQSKAGVSAFQVPGERRKIEQDSRRVLELKREQEPVSVNEDGRTISLSFSSEEPYRRYDWWEDEHYNEVLSHNPDSIDLSRMVVGAPLLYNHDWDQQIGVVDRIWLDTEQNKMRADVRFSRSAFASDIFNDVIDAIRSQVSVGYSVLDAKKTGVKDGEDIITITRWLPFEISIVSIAADTTVGIGRSFRREKDPEEEVPEPIKDENNPDQVEPKEEVLEDEPKEKSLTTPETGRIIIMDEQQLEALRKAEVARMNGIRAVGTQFKGLWLDTEIDDAINGGVAVDEFNIRSLNKLAERGAAVRQAEDPILGLSKKEQEQFSFRKLMLGLMEGKVRELAPFEFECSEAALKKGGFSKSLDQKRAEGGSDIIRVPLDILKGERRFDASKFQNQQRVMTVGTNSGGGYTVATDLLISNFIDVLRNAMILDKLGITILSGLNGNVAIPRQTGGSAWYWVAEAGATTASQATFDQVALSPKTLSAMTDFTRNLLLQSGLDIETFIQTELAIIMAQGIQDGFFNGTGSSNDPLGVLNTTGIGAVAGGTNGAAPTFENLVDMETAVANANVVATNTAYVTNSKVRGKLKKTVKLSNTVAQTVWANNELNDNPAFISNALPSNLTKGTSSGVCSPIIYGAWNTMMLGLWGGLDIMYNPYILSGTGKKRFEVFQSVDVQCRHPEAIAAMKDALTT